MALSISITLMIIMVHIFYFLKKKLSFLQNSIVFMIIAIATKNYITIMTMELKMLKTTDDNFLFVVLLMFREMMIPFIVLIFTNTYLLTSGWKKKILLFIVVLAVMHGMDRLTVHYHVIQYIKWNFIYAAIMDAAFLLFGLMLAKTVLYLKEWESRKHDSRV